MIRNFIFLFLTLSISISNSIAQPTHLYMTDYANKSPLKNVPLKNTKLRIAIYYYGIPKGHVDVVTNEKQEFNYQFNNQNDQSNLAIELIFIADEEKYNAQCHGNTTISNPQKLLITCQRPNPVPISP